MPIKRARKANFEPFESRTANGRYCRITKDMMSSPAWQTLDIFAKVLYLHIKIKYIPGKERDISFTYREGTQLMSSRTFTKNMDKLIEVGFIDLVEHRPFSALCNIYGLSHRWHKYGTPEFVQKTRPKFRRTKTLT